MRNGKSTGQKKAAKRKLRERMKNFSVTIKDVADRMLEEGRPLHYQTVRDALNSEVKYWNQSVIDMVELMITEKKTHSAVQPVTND